MKSDELSWFKGYLEDRRQRVRVGEANSMWSAMKRGVPQGSILGPLLFILYVNDLPHAAKQCHVRQYADDTSLAHVSSDVRELERGLTDDLQNVAKWIDANRLKLNMKKTQLVLMSRKRRKNELDSVCVKLDDQEVARTKSAKCLGVVIDEELKWHEHITNVRKKCFTGLAKLRRLKDVLPLTTKRRIYNAIILPHLDYCSVVWQECAVSLRMKVERVQNYGMRLILSKPARTPSTEMRQILNWVPLERRREMFRLMLVHRCITKRAPFCLCDKLKTNADIGSTMTRGSQKLYVQSVNSESYRRSFTFKGAMEWNKLPSNLRGVGSAVTFRNLLKKHMQHSYFSEFV